MEVYMEIMETLSREITDSFYLPGGYTLLRRVWAEKFNDREARKSLTSGHFLFYQAIRGKALRRSFTSLANHYGVKGPLTNLWNNIPEIEAMFLGAIKPGAAKHIATMLEWDNLYYRTPRVEVKSSPLANRGSWVQGPDGELVSRV